MQARNVLKFLVLLTVMLLPTLAFGQIFGGEIPDEDVSVNKFLNPLFGSLVDRPGGGDPFEALLKEFNLGVLILGGILVFYTLVAGTLSTAHDGEMLGKKWSSMWVPIRTALGAAAIMPAIGALNGYAVIQAVVMWLAMQGVAGANVLWAKYLDGTIETTTLMPIGSDRQIRETFHDMFMSNVCTSGFREGQSRIGALAEKINMNPMVANVSPRDNKYIRGYAYGPMIHLCGQVVMSKGVGPASADNWRLYGEPPASASALIDSNGLAAALVVVHATHLNTAQAKLKEMADKLVKGDLSQEDFDTNMNALVSNYSTDLRNKAIEVYDAQKEAIAERLVEGMKKDGWAMAGMYYMSIVRSQDEVTRAISQTPSASSGRMAGSGSFAIDTMTGGLGKAVASKALNAYVGSGERKAWFEAADELVKNSNKANLTTMEHLADEATDKSWVMKLVSWFINDDMLFMTQPQQFAQQNQNPILMAKNLGENMTAAAWAGFTAGVILLGASGIGAGVAGAWAEVLSGPLFAIFAILVVPGATLSTYVPMIPYILWLGVIVGWLILVLEAIIAAPIWAIAHMAPDGDGVVGRGGQGYMLILSLVLRPPLMILGLVCSITLMNPLGYFINSTFLGSFAVSINPGPMALTQLIAGCIIYVVVMVSVIHRVFTLIHVIPDRILRWIGGGGNELGEQAQGMESFSAAKTVAASAAMNQIGEVSRSVGMGARQLGMKKADKENASMIHKEEARSRMASEASQKGDLSHRAGMQADQSTASADADPTNLDKRSTAAMDNMMARDAYADESMTKAQNFMEQNKDSYPGGDVSGFRDLPMAQREQMAQDMASRNEPMAEAMDFANKMDQARQAQDINPQGDAMKRFMASAAQQTQSKGSQAQSWEKAAAKGLRFESERQRLS